MEIIEIKGLKATARHGVLEEEKRNPQPFVFDVRLELDARAVAESDDVADAVNYAEVSRLVYDFCTGNCFNLVERLAYGAAFLIAEKFTAVRAAEVTVHKPQAPVGLPFDDITVTARVERCDVLLSLGSSIGDGKKALDGAVEALGKLRGVTVKKVSDYIETEPYGGVAKNKFLNCGVRIDCLLSPRGLLEQIHGIEEAFGRVRKLRWEDRTLDIDIIFFGNKIIREEGLSVPHPDYSARNFVITPLKQIAPDFVCPVTGKRLTDM